MGGTLARGVTIALAIAAIMAPAAAAREPGPDLLASERFPIGLWWPPPPAQTTDARYRQIADAGFTFVHGGNGVTGRNRSAGMLEAAQANGLDAVVVDGRLRALTDGDPPEETVRATVAEVLADYRDFPAFAGFNLFDEPNASRFPELAVLERELRRQAPAELPYVNLWPSDVPASDWGTQTYEEYLRRFANEVDPPLLSFDVYPLLDPDDDAEGLRPQPLAEDEETLSRQYFENWEAVRRQALRSDLPAWVFIQSIDYDLQDLLCPCRARRRPTAAEVRWQANVSLAYGAKGIQYFTYWTPASNPGTTFGSGLLDRSGATTDLYEAARAINPDLQAVGRRLAPLESVSIEHATEGALPPGTRRFHRNGWISAHDGAPALIGQFAGSGRSRGHERWVLAVNRSMAEPARMTLTAGRSVRSAERLDTATGRLEATGGRELRLALEPGGAELIRLSR